MRYLFGKCIYKELSSDEEGDSDVDDGKAHGDVGSDHSWPSRSKKKGLSFEDLPPWLQPHYTTHIESAVIAYAGTLDNPWKLDYQSHELVHSFSDVL